jgi:hypothetical protein
VTRLPMDKPTLWEIIKGIIAEIAWRVFVWAADITEAEYLAAVYEDAVRERKSDKDSAWFTL